MVTGASANEWSNDEGGDPACWAGLFDGSDDGDGLRIAHLGPDDRAIARQAFSMMADVFDEPAAPLSDPYLDTLLRRRDLWVLAAIDAGEVVGCVTAHTLPMTRSESAELFIYDLAVRADRQRTGIGRQLVRRLRAHAKVAGIDVVFVPADEEDTDACEFYRAVGGVASPVVMFDLPS